MQKYNVLLLIFLAIATSLTAQERGLQGGEGLQGAGNEEQEPGGSDHEVIRKYDAFNPMLGGDSIRLCNDQPCTGRIRDFYDNGELKHEGFYDRGKLGNTYKNYFSNGQLEREFKARGTHRGTMTIYYPDGDLRSEITFRRGMPQEWTEYNPGGNKSFYERYDRRVDYLEERIFFHENGSKRSHLELIEKAEQKYQQQQFYDDGTLRAEGPVTYEPVMNAYRRNGIWTFYDEQGDPQYRQEYYNDQVVGREEL